MAVTTTLFSAPRLPHHHPLPSFPISRHPFSSLQSTTTLTHSPLIFVRASSSPSTVDKKEEEEEITSSSSTNPDSFTDQSQSIPIGGCKGCGKSEIERGCNGEGRIQGGIATVPGFGWWPIKAYRPCPGFVATGGRYRRQGQSMDEVAGFGTVPRSSAATAAVTVAAKDGTENKSSEKKEGPRKFKR